MPAESRLVEELEESVAEPFCPVPLFAVRFIRSLALPVEPLPPRRPRLETAPPVPNVLSVVELEELLSLERVVPSLPLPLLLVRESEDELRLFDVLRVPVTSAYAPRSPEPSRLPSELRVSREVDDELSEPVRPAVDDAVSLVRSVVLRWPLLPLNAPSVESPPEMPMLLLELALLDSEVRVAPLSLVDDE